MPNSKIFFVFAITLFPSLHNARASDSLIPPVSNEQCATTLQRFKSRPTSSTITLEKNRSSKSFSLTHSYSLNIDGKQVPLTDESGKAITVLASPKIYHTAGSLIFIEFATETSLFDLSGVRRARHIQKPEKTTYGHREYLEPDEEGDIFFISASKLVAMNIKGESSLRVLADVDKLGILQTMPFSFGRGASKKILLLAYDHTQSALVGHWYRSSGESLDKFRVHKFADFFHDVRDFVYPLGESAVAYVDQTTTTYFNYQMKLKMLDQDGQLHVNPVVGRHGSQIDLGEFADRTLVFMPERVIVAAPSPFNIGVCFVPTS